MQHTKNNLQLASSAILQQLNILLKQLSDAEFSRPIPALSGNSIGKHVRHVLEFYQCLIASAADGVVDYDKRERNPRMETDTTFCSAEITRISKTLEGITPEGSLAMVVSFQDGNPEKINTTFSRELAYNIEHAIHHMAIIKIAVIQGFPDIQLDESFGIAYSTLKYNQETCAQ